jgi:membrane protein DedA with SNARE-associated domain
MESLIQTLNTVDPLVFYGALFFIAYIENLFPPMPSDVLIVFGGSLISLGRIDLVVAIAAASIGSTLGFLSMYKIGDWFGDSILEKNRIRFLPLEKIHQVESWLRTYGYWIVIVNRFLAGTRAIVSFAVGMSELNLLMTTILSFLSALVWNIFLIMIGDTLGSNWQIVGSYLTTYSQVISILIALGLGGWLGYRVIRFRKKDG